MNESSNLPAMQNEPSRIPFRKPQKTIGTTARIHTEVYQEIQLALADLQLQLGHKIPLSMFFGKIITNGWKAQVEHLRKVDLAIKRVRS